MNLDVMSFNQQKKLISYLYVHNFNNGDFSKRASLKCYLKLAALIYNMHQ